MALTSSKPEPAAGSDGDDRIGSDHAVRAARSSRLPDTRAGRSPTLIYLAVAVAMAGFGLIAVTWGQVAGEAQVSEQLPWVVSGGFTALGLIMAGLTVINVAVQRGDDSERDRQLDDLVGVLGDLEAAMRRSADPDAEKRSGRVRP